MSAKFIYDHIPIGSIIRYSDGMPRPPERYRKKLAIRKSRSGGGQLVRKRPVNRLGNTLFLPGEWAIVALTFPHLFTAFERRCADQDIRDWHPDAWEEIFGRVLELGESHEKDRHAGNWVVISAVLSTHHPGFTETIAALGGHSGTATKTRCFLVPSDEYCIGRFGFVIDEIRHRRLDLPSEPDHATRD